MLSLAVRSKCFEPIARGHSKIAEHTGLIQKTKLSERYQPAIFRLRRPDQINSASGSAKL
jgi:hypothetical protein